MIIGFTGTRRGMTKAQWDGVLTMLSHYVQTYGNLVIGLHGDCIGADDHFDNICASLNVRRNIRPCTFSNMRANCVQKGAREIASPERPMQRNRDIVADADVMFACPPNNEEIKRGSGTWATIRFAKRARKQLHIFFPDGSVENISPK